MLNQEFGAAPPKDNPNSQLPRAAQNFTTYSLQRFDRTPGGVTNRIGLNRSATFGRGNRQANPKGRPRNCSESQNRSHGCETQDSICRNAKQRAHRPLGKHDCGFRLVAGPFPC